MAVYIWCEAVCEFCATTCAGRFTTGGVPRKTIIEDAKKLGWVIEGYAEDRRDFICPSCQKERAK